MTKTQTPAQTASTDLAEVEVKPNPQSLANTAQDEMRPTVLSVDEETRNSILSEAAKAEAVVAFLLQKGSVASLEMLNNMTRLRRLFPASDEVRALIGEDACDLIGQTDAYKKAIEDVNATALKSLVSRLRRDGYPADVAENIAKARMDTVRKGTSLHYRRYVETLALNTCGDDRTAAAALLLAHGFQHNTAIETKKAAQLIRPGQTVEVAEAEGEGVRSVGGNLLKVLNPAPKAGDKTEQNEPNEQSDQTLANQTADKKEAEALGAEVLDPRALINEAVGMLNRAASLLPQSKLTIRERNAARKALLSAVKNVVGELEGPMDATQVVDVEAEVRSK